MSFIIVILFVDRTLDLGSLLIPSFAFDSFLRFFIADDFPSLSLSLLSRHPTRFTIRLLSTAWTSTSRSYKEKIPRRLPRNSVSRRWTLARLRIAIRMPSLPRTRLKMHCQGPPTPCVHPIDRDVDPVKVGRLGWWTVEIGSVASPLPLHRGCKAWRDHRRSIFRISSSCRSRHDNLWIKISIVN